MLHLPLHEETPPLEGKVTAYLVSPAWLNATPAATFRVRVYSLGDGIYFLVFVLTSR